jgi:hypothetical protein
LLIRGRTNWRGDIPHVVARTTRTFATQTYAKIFALEFELGQPVITKQRD